MASIQNDALVLQPATSGAKIRHKELVGSENTRPGNAFNEEHFDAEDEDTRVGVKKKRRG